MNLAKRWLICFLLIGLTLGGVMLLEHSLGVDMQIPEAKHLKQAEFYFDNITAAQTVTLPHNWDQSFPLRGGIGHYVFQFNLKGKPVEPIGIFLPKLSMNAEVYINGQSIGNGGAMQDPVARNWNLPLYFVSSPAIWHAGNNQIRIDIAGFPSGRSGLSPIFVGPHQRLHFYFDKYRLKIQLLNMGSFSINLLMGFLLLILAYRTKDRSIAYFGIGALVSCIAIADSFWVDVPLHRFVWRWITHAAMAIGIIFFYLFMLRMIRRKLGVFERFMIAYLIAGLITLLAAHQSQLLPWAKWVHFGSLVMMCQLIFLCLRQWLRKADSNQLWLGLCMTAVLSFGLVDWIPAILNHTKNSPYIYFIGPVAFSFAVTYGLLSRYIDAMQAQQQYTQRLQASLRQQEAQLDEQHQKILSLEKDKTLSNERTRIMRELHDGIGGQLMGALALEEGSDSFTAKRIRYALDELRIIMDSLDADADFETILAMLRMRIEPELKKHNIQLQWRVLEAPAVFDASPERCLHGLRIIQEAIINILKHANATEIRVELKPQLLRIKDNGVGIANKKQGVDGRGITNMKWRAEQLSTTLVVRSDGEGTSVELHWS